MGMQGYSNRVCDLHAWSKSQSVFYLSVLTMHYDKMLVICDGCTTHVPRP